MRRSEGVVLLISLVLVLTGCTDSSQRCSTGTVMATFRYSPTGGELPVLVTFDASESTAGGSSILKYEWDFGDGTKAEGVVVNKRFDRRPDGPDEQTFTVTLTVTRGPAVGEPASCIQTAKTRQTLTYGVSRPLDIVQWDVKEIYYGTLIEGYVRVAETGIRVTHGQVIARFYRGPEHTLVLEVPMRDGVWNLRPGELRYFAITSPIRTWQFDWVELRTVAMAGPI